MVTKISVVIVNRVILINNADTDDFSNVYSRNLPQVFSNVPAGSFSAYPQATLPRGQDGKEI